jgi:hypothetical protein
VKAPHASGVPAQPPAYAQYECDSQVAFVEPEHACVYFAHMLKFWKSVKHSSCASQDMFVVNMLQFVVTVHVVAVHEHPDCAPHVCSVENVQPVAVPTQ